MLPCLIATCDVCDVRYIPPWNFVRLSASKGIQSNVVFYGLDTAPCFLCGRHYNSPKCSPCGMSVQYEGPFNVRLIDTGEFDSFEYSQYVDCFPYKGD